MLRNAARSQRPLDMLTLAAEHFYAARRRPDGFAWPDDRGPVEPFATALADLAVTGRAAYERFRDAAPDVATLLPRVRSRLQRRYDSPVDDRILGESVRQALDRAYDVAWALRGPVNVRASLRGRLGWIAVSGEDDPPHRPVNVPSAPYPQHEVTVTVETIPVTARYIIASPTVPSGERPEARYTVPPDEPPHVPSDSQLILFIHGHSSRLEEALDLIPCLHRVGAEQGRTYSIISLDLPCCGYSSMFDHERVAPSAQSQWHLGDDVPLRPSSSYPILDFIETFLTGFVDALDQQMPVKNIKRRIAAVAGGSLGGNMGLRLGRRDLEAHPWLRTIVSWSAASVWNSYENASGIDDLVKGLALDTAKGNFDPSESDELEPTDAREEYFHGVFEERISETALGAEIGVAAAAPPGSQTPILMAASIGRMVLTKLPTQPEMWYRDGWSDKERHIEGTRKDRWEIYNTWFRMWHWRVAYEQLVFSHLDPVERGGPPAYTRNKARTLLLAGEEDDYMFTNIYSATRELAPLMSDTPGKAIFVKETGHSIHNERPHFLATEIADFTEDFTMPLHLAEASWTHAHDVSVEHPDRLDALWRAGFFVRLQGRPDQHTWLHFAVPTPVIVDGERLRIGSVMLRYRTGAAARVDAVHVYDGERRIAAHDELDAGASDWRFQRFSVAETPPVRWGLGLSVRISFGGAAEAAARRIEFSAAGCDFLA